MDYTNSLYRRVTRSANHSLEPSERTNVVPTLTRNFNAGPSTGPTRNEYTDINSGSPAPHGDDDSPVYRALSIQNSLYNANFGTVISTEDQFINYTTNISQPPDHLTNETTTSPKLIVMLKIKLIEPIASTPTSQLTQITTGTQITRDEADQRSLPPAGDQLTSLVEDAKSRKEIPKCHNTDNVRLVDGHWMAPAACKNCQETKKSSLCDRNAPCKTCNNKQIPCITEGLMMFLRPSKRQIPMVKSELPIDSQVVNQSSTAIKRKRGGRINAVSDNDAIAETEDQEMLPSNVDEFSHPFKIPKPAEADEGFSPDDRQLSPDDLEEIVPPAKRQCNAKLHSSGVEKASGSKARARSVKEAYHLNVQEGKPEPFGQPQVWAAKRQQLCETLPYYRAYESAAYTKDGILYAFLIDREVGLRDKFTDQIIISKCGGGKCRDADGNVISKDPEKYSTGAAFFRARNDNLPVAVIAGQGNIRSPSKLPHYYNVLDWFHVTDVWWENIDSIISLVARLEKINLEKMSWWAPKDHILSPANFTSPKAQDQICPDCNQSSKIIFSQGFTCLQRQCKRFFVFETEYEDLDYSLKFLDERAQYRGKPPMPISPPLITLDEEDFGYEEKYRKGIVCPECRCCSRRIHWNFWSCENDGCNFVYQIPQRGITVKDAIQQGRNSSRCQRLPKTFTHPDIRWTMKSVGFYEVHEYVIPGEEGGRCGFVRLFKSNGIINDQPGGPNDLFQQMQTKHFDLKRNAARLSGNVKEVSTAHFGANWGAPYKYGVAQESKRFDEAPEVIIKAVKRLTWAGEQSLSENHEPFHPFNEMLTLGYFEQGYIGFHDDGEKELGPTVATLSLGADATMEFRRKVKKTTKENNHKTPKVDDQSDEGRKRVKLSFTLSHGDMIVMHGCGIQKFYEHAVRPHGKLRYALTSRFIDPARMVNKTDREYSMKAGTLPPGSERYNYDGDVNAQPVKREQSLNQTAIIDNHIDALRLTGELSAEDEMELLTRRLQALRQNETMAVVESDMLIAVDPTGVEKLATAAV